MSLRIAVDGEALRADIKRTASFGGIETDIGRGRTALSADAANAAARDYLVERLEAADLDVRVDAIGNIAGRWTPPDTDPDIAPIASGSHLDSVPRGGIFDGPLGVYAALEAVRAIKRSGAAVARPIEVVCFTGEEGTRFADGVLGSTVAAGKRGIDETLALSDDDVTLREALEGAGFQGTGRLDASRWDAWIELHIEQCSRLEDAGVPLGLVTDIAGTTRCHVSIEGETDHAGTTGMTERRDALAAASELVLAVERTAVETATTGGGTTVGTVGSLTATPNAVNVIPGSVSLRLDCRSVEPAEIRTQLATIEHTLSTLEMERDVSTSVDCPYDISPTSLSGRCLEVMAEAARDSDIETRSVHSGAGHDTMQIASATDAALLFVASEGGYSHSPRERADWDDCTIATGVLAESLVRLANDTDHTRTSC
ncbi:hydantoinase/carbamoylase family amidase [Halococcus sp. IIIV-5B]|uniref:hydantoinase/carbamoylase family amidase n=1 Tax=Halococcus sp. IIIV-5B TaxID=2321230 RepID=UPI001F2CF950|nr:hydantoinase/carbamoylase family amidase [Halococcus sp. IIIV-5B]